MIDWDARTLAIVRHYAAMARNPATVEQARDSVKWLTVNHGVLWSDLGERVKKELNAPRS